RLLWRYSSSNSALRKRDRLVPPALVRRATASSHPRSRRNAESITGAVLHAPRCRFAKMVSDRRRVRRSLIGQEWTPRLHLLFILTSSRPLENSPLYGSWRKSPYWPD